MKVESIEEIAKRLGQQKGKSYSYYSKKGGSEGLIKKLLLSLLKKEK